MLRLNRITDYAVVVLTQMVREPDKQVTAPQLSEESSVPAPTVAKVLKALARWILRKAAARSPACPARAPSASARRRRSL